MTELRVCNLEGTVVGTVSVDLGPKTRLRSLHQTVLAQQAGAHHGTHATKGRSQVRGGGRKPYRQKGTGRARQGSRRAPHWKGGATVHGPKPRDYHQRTPRAIRRAAFRSAFASRLEEERVHVIDPGGGGDGKTPALFQTLLRLDLADRRVLLIASRDESGLLRAGGNIPSVRPQRAEQTGVLDVLKSDAIVCTRAAWDELARRLSA